MKTMAEIIGIRLPYPPSMNHYWRHCRGMTFISAAGMKFRKNAADAFAKKGAPKLTGRLAAEIELCPPTMTRGTDKQPPRKFGTPMDLDNALKAMLDALQHAGAYDNDSQIKRLSIWEGPSVPSGLALVTIREIPPDGPEWTPAQLFDEKE